MARKLSEIASGTTDRIPLYITGIEENESKNGPWCKITVMDGTKAEVKMWNTRKSTIEKYLGKIVELDVEAREYNGAPSYIVKNIYGMTDRYNLGEFIRKAPKDSEEMFNENLAVCLAAAGGDRKNDLYRITEYLYNKYKEQILYWPAAVNNHHAFYAGLLYHSYRMVQLAAKTADVYGRVNKALLVCGAALHDIGKVTEITSNDIGIGERSVEGVLFGHIEIGQRMVEDAAAALSIEMTEEVMLLRHMIASHHGELEWGSPVRPCTPEAFILHHIDMIDFCVEACEEEYEGVQSGDLSKSVRALNTRLYKPTWF